MITRLASFEPATISAAVGSESILFCAARAILDGISISQKKRSAVTWSGYSSDSTVDIAAEVTVAAAAMREWDRQHGWLHSPKERATDTREAEQELAKVVAALRTWHAAAATATTTTT